jgi:hypothetical protein
MDRTWAQGEPGHPQIHKPRLSLLNPQPLNQIANQLKLYPNLSKQGDV